MSSKVDKKGCTKQLQATESDSYVALEDYAEAFGAMEHSSSLEEVISKTKLAHEYTNQIMESDWKDITHTKSIVIKEQNILTAIKGINPQDPMESMLASQMIVAHNAAMKAFAKAESYNMNQDIAYKKLSQATLSTANKLLRTYAIQMETLNRYRGKGQQKITVEYININDGGKAVIGNITTNNSKQREG